MQTCIAISRGIASTGLDIIVYTTCLTVYPFVALICSNGQLSAWRFIQHHHTSPEGKTVDGGCLLLLSCLTPSGFTCYPWGRIHWTKAKSGERCYDLQQLHLMPWVKAQMMGDFNRKILQRTQTIGMWSESSRYKDWVCVTCLMYILRLLYPNPIYSKQDQPINSVVLVAQACVKKHLFEACRGQVACSSWLRMQQEFHVPRAFRQNETKTLRGVVIHFRVWCCQLSGIVKSGSRQLWMAKFPLLGIFRAFREENLLESQTLCSLLTPSLLAEQWSIQSGFVGAWKKAIVKHTYLYYQILYNIICTFIMKWTWCSSMYIDITHRISIKAHGVL